jgi:hypothetical protein
MPVGCGASQSNSAAKINLNTTIGQQLAVDRVHVGPADAKISQQDGVGRAGRATMRATGFKHVLAGIAVGTTALSGAGYARATPVLASTAAVKAAVPRHVTDIGYIYRDYNGAWINSGLAVGFLEGSAVTPFYGASYYAPYVYYAPPVYYTPLPYYGPAIVYGRPILAPDPYYPAFYPYIRSAGHYGGYWRQGRYPFRGYRGYRRY